MSCTERMLILYHLSVCPPLYLGDRAAQEFRDLLVKWLGTGELDAKKVRLISHYAFASKGLGVEDLGLDYVSERRGWQLLEKVQASSQSRLRRNRILLDIRSYVREACWL